MGAAYLSAKKVGSLLVDDIRQSCPVPKGAERVRVARAHVGERRGGEGAVANLVGRVLGVGEGHRHRCAGRGDMLE